MEPGEYFLRDEPIDNNLDRPTHTISLRNTPHPPQQVGSHYHFFEVNKALDFDRAAAMGMRLDIVAGHTTRFEPGDTREVQLVEYTGRRRSVGFNALVDGSMTSAADVRPALERARLLGFKGTQPPEPLSSEAQPAEPRSAKAKSSDAKSSNAGPSAAKSSDTKSTKRQGGR
jgi:urease beta subunit